MRRWFIFWPVPAESIEVRPSPLPRHVVNPWGKVEAVPAHWDLLPPGDPALSRRIKADGPSWTVIEPKGRKRFSRGIWAPADRIAALRAELVAEREHPSYQRKLDAGRQRRAAVQDVYAGDFREAVRRFLGFHRRHSRDGEFLAGLIAAQATPVGSGTVARTQRIPIEQRAEAATIAWLRHQTTAYDRMTIARHQGARQEVRHEIAERSRQLLTQYRHGHAINPATCPLARALAQARELDSDLTADF